MGLFDRFRRHHVSTAPPAAEPVHQPGAVAHAAGDGSPDARFAVIDVETTGLSPGSHRIVELAVVTIDPMGGVLDEWSTRVNPQGPVGATHIHGITDADVAQAPLFIDVIEMLNRRLAGAAVAAHNARFDLAFLRAEYARAGWDLPHVPSLCTLQASEYFLPALDRRRLADCCWALGTPLVGAHSALGDARATAGLLSAFLRSATGRPPQPEHLRMPTEALAVVWPVRASRTPSAWQPKSPRRPAPPARVQHALVERAAAPVAPALVEVIERFSLIDALDDGAPAGSLVYLEKLAQVLEDGVITAEEAADLASVADAEKLSTDDVAIANRAFVMTLAHAALEDGKVTRTERAELLAIADLLGVDQKIVPALLAQAETARNNRLSAGLKELPPNWAHGDPLRVGDKVVFTGCDDHLRAELERRSERLGVRVIGSVSAKTAMLVSDGTVDGTKAAKARELGIRMVHPAAYAVLLEHLQPSISHAAAQTSNPAVVRLTSEGATARSEAAGPTMTSAVSPAAIRAWARANGYEVGVRGRLQLEVINAYSAANAS